MMKKILTIFVTLLLGVLLGSSITAILMKNEQTQPAKVAENNTTEVNATNIDYQKLPTINTSQAKAIAIFKKFYSNAEINEIALNIEHDKYVYEIEGFDTVKDCTLKINAANGAILGQSTLRRDSHDSELEAIEFKKTISRQDAGNVAIKAVGSGKAIAWTLTQNSEADYPIWTVKVANGNEVHQLKINALNKEIIE